MPSTLRPLITLALVLQGAPAMADACLDEVRAFYAQHLDPFARRPHRTVTQVYNPDGTPQRIFDAVIESPMRTIAGVAAESHYTLAIDSGVWNGPTHDGPWTDAGAGLPEDRDAVMRLEHQQRTANLRDAACNGMVERDGRMLLNYAFSTQSDPDPDRGGYFYGATHSLFVDPDTMEPQVWEMTAFVNPWSQAPGMDRHVVTFTYDDGIRLTAPE
ncbi:MAG: hypothetical protein ACE368_04700 [Paracoccaceae bacterium]